MMSCANRQAGKLSILTLSSMLMFEAGLRHSLLDFPLCILSICVCVYVNHDFASKVLSNGHADVSAFPGDHGRKYWSPASPYYSIKPPLSALTL